MLITTKIFLNCDGASSGSEELFEELFKDKISDGKYSGTVVGV